MTETGTTQTPATPAPVPPRTQTILLFEPDVLVRMVIADHLRDCGYKVIETATADDVLTLLNAEVEIDIVFSGGQPQNSADNFSLAHRIRLVHPKINVILTSGIESAAQKAHDMCLPGNLTKHANPQEVVRRIHFLRERHRTYK